MTSLVGMIQSGDFSSPRIFRNGAVARFYEHGVQYDDCRIADSGALAACSGEKTGRCPKDKRIVEEPSSRDEIWWGDINHPFPPESHDRCLERAISFLDRCDRLYVVDGFAGWDARYRIKIRVICSRAYHALFMHNMLIRPTASELAAYGSPDYTIYNAGQHSADDQVEGIDSDTCVSLNLAKQEMVVLGTEYAGEMKKGVFTIMNYLMPLQHVLAMHCSANQDYDGRVSLFFGLSGTGKTTLSADPQRHLIGDDEHCWTDHGIFNIEGGCYAKCIGLAPEREPQITNAIRFGSVLENTILDPSSCQVDYDDDSLTQNTRASYPLEFIPNVNLPAVGGHPENIIFLTCDAFGVLPPVSRLNPAQAMYHYISGYTAKIAGTEQGVNEPVDTFSACFGAAFLPLSPNRYAELLAQKMRENNTKAWLVNTGWTGGSYGVGTRIELATTRAIIDAIHNNTLDKSEFVQDSIFGFEIPTICPGVPNQVLHPRQTWSDPVDYDLAAVDLAQRFQANFKAYEHDASEETRKAGPQISPALKQLADQTQQRAKQP